MALVFNLKHAAYAGAGASVGAILGYLFGIVLFIVVLASSAFVQSGTPMASAIYNAATSSGIFPFIFALAFAAIGFFGGFYISVTSDEAAEKAAAKA